MTVEMAKMIKPRRQATGAGVQTARMRVVVSQLGIHAVASEGLRKRSRASATDPPISVLLDEMELKRLKRD
jgi:hypothetical protein